MANSNQKAVLAVVDGFGFSRIRSKQVIDTAWAELSATDRGLFESTADRIGRDPVWAKNLLFPVQVESLESDTPTREALTWIDDLQTCRGLLSDELIEQVDSLVESVADKHHYVPWASGASHLWALRNANLSIPTSAAGIWAGFEDLDPAVQGNSETGHQQIGNTELAPQLPLEITNSINSGEFFENPALNSTITAAKSVRATINFCFLLSGVSGADGRVHSAWNHLEAFLELVFERRQISPAKVQMQAILDGRDSATNSSIVAQNGSGDFIGQLQQLLSKYDAEQSLAWVVGRSTAMDRDYREESARTDFDLLTGNTGESAAGFDEVRSIIAATHDSGKTDQDVPPIAIIRPGGTAPSISEGDAFIDLNFRSDRQRSKIASLAGARNFLESEGESRGRIWDGSWIDHNLDLDICAIAEYHPVFESEYGVRVAFHTEPHAANFLAQWSEIMDSPESGGAAEYTLVAESVKSSHMGYFLRGRREYAVEGSNETRFITPSHGEEDGVKSDTDFYLHPGMRAKEVTADVLRAIEANTSRLICCNIAAPDMVGHLLPSRYEEAKEAYRAAADALAELAEAAQKANWHLVITADHGNIEDDTSAHSVNDVLTTIVQPGNAKARPALAVFQARLFDIAPTLLDLLGASPPSRDQRNPPLADHFVGRPLVAPK
ncbi:MAG: alkaline phosphatase family protein [Dehalococcoidia bacterium]|nr:alkaline phosphatase family protein [Dehalococcoidia bacterium]MDP7485961.1 alkaline phosphatase family protein [Dehalococcoidia bacterium]